ncbi:MAG TPA: transposase, partial [Nitrospirae bacterium]|nr:transposase [Nitrospirota bacterium]
QDRFDEIFQEETCFVTLNLALKRLYKNKAELLLVLDRPEIPLHNNASETDIREYVKRRKVSGGTRSDAGRKCRDTFTSLKKTSRKLNVSFWLYLNDRIGSLNAISLLDQLMRLRSPSSTF